MNSNKIITCRIQFYCPRQMHHLYSNLEKALQLLCNSPDPLKNGAVIYFNSKAFLNQKARDITIIQVFLNYSIWQEKFYK